MNEIANCANCNTVFVKGIRNICKDCFVAEEKAFEIVYRFLIQRKNRKATLAEIVEATDVEEALIIKFIKDKRLQTTQFPMLGYPCEQCKVDIVSGRLCNNCSQGLLNEFEKVENMEAQRTLEQKNKRKQANIYYSFDQREN